jgi:hypothetical protein
MKARIWYLVLQVRPPGQVPMAAPLDPTRVAKPGVHGCDALSHARSSCYKRKVWEQIHKVSQRIKVPVLLIPMHPPQKSCCGSGSLSAMFCVTSIGHTWRDGASELGVLDRCVLALKSRSPTWSSRRAPHPPLPLLTQQML